MEYFIPWVWSRIFFTTPTPDSEFDVQVFSTLIPESTLGFCFFPLRLPCPSFFDSDSRLRLRPPSFFLIRSLTPIPDSDYGVSGFQLPLSTPILGSLVFFPNPTPDSNSGVSVLSTSTPDCDSKVLVFSDSDSRLLLRRSSIIYSESQLLLLSLSFFDFDS